MNIQAMMKQAQKLQKDMMDEKNIIDNTEFVESTSIVTVKALGNKEIKNIKINMDLVEKEDMEMLEDMILVSINNLFKKIDLETESKMGKYTKGMPGLF